MQRVTSTAFEELADPLALDMISVFSIAEEDTYKLLDKAEKEGWNSETLISEINKMFSGEGNADTETE